MVDAMEAVDVVDAILIDNTVADMAIMFLIYGNFLGAVNSILLAWT